MVISRGFTVFRADEGEIFEQIRRKSSVARANRTYRRGLNTPLIQIFQEFTKSADTRGILGQL